MQTPQRIPIAQIDLDPQNPRLDRRADRVEIPADVGPVGVTDAQIRAVMKARREVG